MSLPEPASDDPTEVGPWSWPWLPLLLLHIGGSSALKVKGACKPGNNNNNCIQPVLTLQVRPSKFRPCSLALKQEE